LPYTTLFRSLQAEVHDEAPPEPAPEVKGPPAEIGGIPVLPAEPVTPPAPPVAPVVSSWAEPPPIRKPTGSNSSVTSRRPPEVKAEAPVAKPYDPFDSSVPLPV